MKNKRPRATAKDHIDAARVYLSQAFMEDESLGRLTMECDDGHKTTLEEVQKFLCGAQDYCEDKLPREVARKRLAAVVENQKAAGN